METSLVNKDARPATPSRPHAPGAATRPAQSGPHRPRRTLLQRGLPAAEAPDVSGLLYRRDQPEIIIPTLAQARTFGPGAPAWTMGPYATLATALEFGAAPLTVVGLITSSVNGTQATGNTTLEQPRIFAYDLATGLGGAGGAFARVHHHLSVRVVIVGHVDDAISANCHAIACDRLHLAPTIVPASTILAIRAAISDAGTTNAHRAYAVCYPDPMYEFATLDPARLDFDDVLPALAETTLPYGGAAWTFGAWTTVDAAAATDYLLTGLTMRTDLVGSGNDAQIELAVGAAGSEVIQARGAISRMQSTNNGARNEFSDPVLVLAGERLAARAAVRSGPAATYITVEKTALL